MSDHIPFYRTFNFWKNVAVILCAAIVIAAVAGGVGYMIGKDKSGTKDKETSPTVDVIDEDSIWGDDEKTEKLTFYEKLWRLRPKKEEPIPEKLHINVSEVRALCESEGLSPIKGETGTGFIALDESMMMIVTVEELQGKTLDTLVEEYLTSSAPLDTRDMVKKPYMALYEGYLDDKNRSMGYCYLEIIVSNGYYVMVQGLSNDPSDPVIAKTRLFAFHLEEKLHIH